MSSAAIKISLKGQIVIPKNIRDSIKTDFLLLHFDDVTHNIILHPVLEKDELGGSLKEYANEYITIEKAREIVKEKVKDDWLRS